MKIFTAISSIYRSDLEDYREMAYVLAKSIKKNTDLEIFCIYDSNEKDEFVKKFEKIAGENHVIYHKLKYEKEVEDFLKWKNAPLAIKSVFLRLDMPLILDKISNNDEFCFYVDSDTIFLKNINLDELKTKTLRAGPEFHPFTWHYFNAGVIFYNNKYIKETYNDFISFIYSINFRDNISGATTPHVQDQTYLNLFYGKYFEKLPIHYNWKPYWGDPENATILHFHGPKPKMIEKFLEDKRNEVNCPDLIYQLFKINKNSMEKSLKIYNSILNS